MSVYDGVVGIDETAVNEFVASVYEVAHATLVVGNWPLGMPVLGITSFDYDFASMPVVTLAPSSVIRDAHRALLDELDLLDEGDRDTAAEAQSQGSFEIRVDKVTIVVHYADQQVQPTRIDVALTAGARVAVESTGLLTPVVNELKLDVPGDPVLTEVLNKAIAPFLIMLIGTVLEPIRIPPLAYGSVQVTPPTVATGSGRLLATTALLPTLPEPAPLDGAWPVGTAFAGVDAKLIDALLDSIAAEQPITGSWSKTYRIVFVSLTINATYSATLSGFDLQLVPGADGQLHGTARVTGTAHLWTKEFSITADISATPTARATASMSPDNQLMVKLDAIEDLEIELDVHNVPGFIDGILSDLVNAFGSAIAAAVTGTVTGMPARQVTQIPSIRIPIPAKAETVVLTLKDADVRTIQTPDGKNLLGLSGGASVVVTPTVQHTLRRQLVVAGS